MKTGRGLHLYTSNRLENLADALSENIRQACGSALAPEIIMVQSKGMQKWLSLKLAQKNGICANCHFPFPNTLVQRLFSVSSENQVKPLLFERDVMAFRIMLILPEMVHIPVFSPLKNYLGDDTFSLKSYQLSRHLADLLDQYTIYRPDMITGWEKGEEGGWQAELWRKISSRNEHFHRAALQREFLSSCRDGSLNAGNLPGRINVFGISALPLFHLELLAAAAEYIEINLYLLNPCKEYWFDIISSKDNARRQVRELSVGGTPFESLHFETGNPLLASFGGTAVDFFGMLFDLCDFQEHSLFDNPGERDLLTILQADIHLCRNRGGKEKVAVSPADGSLQVHSCHTPLREMEVLHNFLLSCFENLKDLRPSDVLVMAPDIEQYAPYISAVFDSVEDEKQKIPYTVADRTRREANRIAGFFFELLALRKSRFEVSRIIDLLESPEIQRRFDIQGDDLELICHWLAETRIRWGKSAEERSAKGLPPYPDNTWKAGLDRLLLGYALPGDDRQMFEGILPYGDIEGTSTTTLGKICVFFEALADAVQNMETEISLAEWVEWLKKLLQGFFQPDSHSESEYLEIDSVIDDLGKSGGRADFQKKIDFEVVEAYLTEKLGESYSSSGRFFSGAVTFCAMLPMRSIPFRVIAIVGLNDGRFPRKTTPLNFDLINAFPRRGDRSLRQEDKYLFLETLISAREKLYISYIGQNVRDNSDIQPSVVVSELLEYLEASFTIAGSAKTVTDHVLTRHPLQAFDSFYFRKESRFRSYSRENLTALLSFCKGSRKKTAMGEPLPPPEEDWKFIDTADFLSFFSHPARFFLRRRLGVFLEEESSIPEDREAFQLKGLEKYELGNFLTDTVLQGEKAEENYLAVRERGMLPHGACGKIAFNELAGEACSLADRVKSVVQENSEIIIDIQGGLDDFQFSGRVSGVYGDTLVRYRFARIKAAERLRVWIELAIMRAFLGHKAPSRSVVIGIDAEWECQAHPDSGKILNELLQLYWQGLTEPLVFFPETSLAFARALKRNPDKPDRAWDAARRTWEPDEFGRSEAEDPYNELCFKDIDPLNEDFEQLALQVFEPILESGKGL